MMTVVAIMAGLMPILWSTGAGSEVMQRIAVPMIGGMVSLDRPDACRHPRDIRCREGNWLAEVTGALDLLGPRRISSSAP